jgi:hypothetical protein
MVYMRSGNGGWAAGKKTRERRVRMDLTVERIADGDDGKGSNLVRRRSPFSVFSILGKINKINSWTSVPKRANYVFLRRRRSLHIAMPHDPGHHNSSWSSTCAANSPYTTNIDRTDDIQSNTPLVDHFLLQCTLLVAGKHSWVISGLISLDEWTTIIQPLHRETLLSFKDKPAIEMT